MLLLNIILSHLFPVKGVPIYYNIIRMQVGIHVIVPPNKINVILCALILYIYMLYRIFAYLPPKFKPYSIGVLRKYTYNAIMSPLHKI